MSPALFSGACLQCLIPAGQPHQAEFTLLHALSRKAALGYHGRVNGPEEMP